MNDITLEDLRTQIDQVDQQLIAALHHRMELVKQVGVFKKRHSLPPLDQKRWQAVLDSKIALAKQKGLDESLVHDIYERIHQTTLEIQKQI